MPDVVHSFVPLSCCSCWIGGSEEAALVPYSCLSADHSDAERVAAYYSDDDPPLAPPRRAGVSVTYFFCLFERTNQFRHRS